MENIKFIGKCYLLFRNVEFFSGNSTGLYHILLIWGNKQAIVKLTIYDQCNIYKKSCFGFSKKSRVRLYLEISSYVHFLQKVLSSGTMIWKLKKVLEEFLDFYRIIKENNFDII